MRDPFDPPGFLVKATQPIARSLALRTLPLHAHEILPAFCFYEFVNTVISPRVSTYLFPDVYPKLSRKTKVNWNVHFVSLVQSCFINVVTLWVIYNDRERMHMGWRERVWGYTGATGMVQGFAAGYFLWDLLASIKHVDIHGWGALAHAGSALVISSLGFRPFVNYYGLNFVLYELSTPFLNIHWCLDKIGMTGSTAQLINGIALITTFGCSRLIWGTYQSVRMFQDVWRATEQSEELPIPRWLALVYLGSMTLLSGLNFYWFGQMIRTVTRRFRKPKTETGEKRD